MRADRLISIILLLQIHKKRTAQNLAVELEVSERTIYRDIDALCIAGVPIYSDSGHGGGYALLDDYHTNLTGLTKEELRALFLLGSLAPLSDLGLSSALQAALLKIAASLPDSNRSEDMQIQHYFYFDSTWDQQSDSQVPLLRVVQEAVLQNRKLVIVYQTPYSLKVEKIISPIGLVAKAGNWYLVYVRGETYHVHNISKLVDARSTNERFDPPINFDLENFWGLWCAERESYLSNFNVSVKVAPSFVPFLSMYFGHQIKKKIDQAGQPDEEGWIRLELSFESFEAARDRLLSLGGGIEVLAPTALRLSILDYAEQIIRLYQ